MLFVPEGVFLPPDYSPIVQGPETIERSWADLFKNVSADMRPSPSNTRSPQARTPL